MSTKHLHRNILCLIFISFFLAANCNEKAVIPQDDFYSNFTKAQLDSLTLSSLTKVENYPFYTMTYYGDYGFSNDVKPGDKTFSSATKKARFSEKPFGCTCFAAMADKNATILGRNFDWYDHIPLLLFTDPPDGFASVSMVDLEYFGFTRNNLPDKAQNNRRLLDTPWLPFDGMNEMGVAIGMMAIPHAESPSDPKKKTIGEIEVIRLVLDYANSTEHAIELIKKYNVRMETPPIHYLIADLAGHSAIIEFVNDGMIVMRNSEPWQVSTNFIIHDSGAPENISCWRYNKVYNKLKESTGKVNKKEAMNLLQSVAQSNTIWSMVYQVNDGKVTVVVGRNYDNIKSFELKTNLGR